mmetsp:Transcript_94855/g.182328  ORF Transcript_94855/g.182328 Transcript_94855/m.182328 type:complete len:105 (-) Transcript_94855:50-364(-)
MSTGDPRGALAEPINRSAEEPINTPPGGVVPLAAGGGAPARAVADAPGPARARCRTGDCVLGLPTRREGESCWRMDPSRRRTDPSKPVDVSNFFTDDTKLVWLV